MPDPLIFLVALSLTEFIHNAIEVWGMRQKVQWLGQAMAGQKHGKWPINIDSKLKTVILHALILFASTSFFVLVLNVVQLSNDGLIITGVSALMINYIFTTWKVDRFHKEIGRIIELVKGHK